MSCDAGTHLTSGNELRAGLESPFVLAGGDGSAMLGIVIRPPDPATRRSPISLALVIDVSGSMEGPKIEHARAAARAAVDALADDDEVSLVTFDSAVLRLQPLTGANAAVRAHLRTAIDGLRAGSGTALFDGVTAGVDELSRAHRASRRLLLISDGRGNAGPSTAPEILAQLPPLASTVSAIGVGTDYDDAVLTAIAHRGVGGFHHLNDPVQLTQILERELTLAHRVVGTNAAVEIAGQPGVTFLDGAGLSLQRIGDGHIRIAVGDLHAGESRTLTVPIRLPVSGGAEATVGRVRLRYQPTDGGPVRVSEVGVSYRVTRSRDEVARAAVPEFVLAADRARVAHALSDAAALLKQGDLVEAQSILRDERARLTARRDKLAGSDRADADALITLLQDPYVDAPTRARPTAAPPLATGRFDALVQLAREGRPLPEVELRSLDRAQLRVLRNVPYARHGYRFDSVDLHRRFAALGWYRPDPAFDNRRLSRVDADNIALVHTYETSGALAAAPIAHALPAAAARARLDTLLARSQRGEAIGDGELAELDLVQLRILRNASYARHGRQFRTHDLQTAFSARPWYRADPQYAESRLTGIDTANIQRIQARERALVAQAGAEPLRDFELRSRARAWQALHP